MLHTHGSDSLRLAVVRQIRGKKLRLQRLCQRTEFTDQASLCEGDKVIVTMFDGSRHLATVHGNNYGPGEPVHFKYDDGGVPGSVTRDKIRRYMDEDKQWDSTDVTWAKAKKMVAIDVVHEMGIESCVRVPAECRKDARVNTYAIDDDATLTGKLMDSIKSDREGDRQQVEEEQNSDWIPELDRGAEVAKEWILKDRRGALVNLVAKGGWRGMTDGSQLGQSGTYGWILMRQSEWRCASGKVVSLTRDMDSYRTELHGIMSLMAGAWECVDDGDTVMAYCDNDSVVKGFKKVRVWVAGGCRGEAPTFKHSVDLWDEVIYWCKKWKLNFSLEWHRGHPEDRHETTDTWSGEDWMNHIADRLADAEYGRDGGVDAPGCLRHQGRWRLLHEGNRVTSLTPDALDLLQETLMAVPAAHEQNISMSDWDRQATKVATGYVGILNLRVWYMRNAWDRGWLNVNRVRWKQARRRSRRDGTGHALGNAETWCKMCDEKVPEDGRHMLCRCRHAAYKNMRKRWYKGVKDKFKKLSPRMVEALYQVVGNNEDTFLDMAGGLVGVLSAWDAVTAKIPILWTKMAKECGVEEDEYHSFLRWYGNWTRKELWSKMRMVRTRELAKLQTEVP